VKEDFYVKSGIALEKDKFSKRKELLTKALSNILKKRMVTLLLCLIMCTDVRHGYFY